MRPPNVEFTYEEEDGYTHINIRTDSEQGIWLYYSRITNGDIHYYWPQVRVQHVNPHITYEISDEVHFLGWIPDKKDIDFSGVRDAIYDSNRLAWNLVRELEKDI